MKDYFYFLFKIVLAAAASRGSMTDYLKIFHWRLRRQTFTVFLTFETKPPAGQAHGGSIRDYFLFSICGVMDRLSPQRYTNNLFKISANRSISPAACTKVGGGPNSFYLE